jgi:hypothetical protein
MMMRQWILEGTSGQIVARVSQKDAGDSTQWSLERYGRELKKYTITLSIGEAATDTDLVIYLRMVDVLMNSISGYMDHQIEAGIKNTIEQSQSA